MSIKGQIAVIFVDFCWDYFFLLMCYCFVLAVECHNGGICGGKFKCLKMRLPNLIRKSLHAPVKQPFGKVLKSEKAYHSPRRNLGPEQPSNALQTRDTVLAKIGLPSSAFFKRHL